MHERLGIAALTAAVVALFATEAAADTLDQIRERGYFAWGADQEGGGPYVYPDPEDPERLLGFEVELAAHLARALGGELGRPIEARFIQGPWDGLPALLDTGRIDIVLNGYEWSPERARVMTATAPYYVYRLQLLARAADDRITNLASLGGKERYRVGVLGGSAAESYLRERFGEAIELSLYDGNTNAMLDVQSGRLDATLQDLPIATFYKKEFPKLRFVDAAVAPADYVMFVRKADTALAAALDRAIARLREDGELRRIYERYGIWTEDQAQQPLAHDDAGASSPEPGFLAKHGRTLLEAAAMTVLLAVTAMPIAIILGLLIAVGRLYGPRPLARLLAVYVEVLRGTPLLLQLLVIFYLLPSVGITMHPVAAAILGLAINYSAYEAEIYRAGLMAVPPGQLEAALTLGMSRRLALRRIVVPQAARLVIPPVTNDFIALFKDTSVCSVVTVVELSKRYNIAVMNSPGDLVPLAVTAALLYLVMSYPLSLASRRMEATQA